ncbi:competence/damage-inducible protein A [Evansella sp. LMS18]|jgi:nicotinamide-nucleotide amidase|uniref:competence/damage-inducible protein A n=1 Tax=Evansella sp. LMS18 TaxID=2924033 RepID=UPI0020D1050F|nr:competence/damage-inducible protein A [Evansella sp. LMS18]UTR10802.1 competence/damage-inducible protein A [Evansella sp. LMS18]
MNGEIVAVGSELLLGQIANTNAQFLSEQMNQLGINIYYHSVAGDNRERLAAVIENARKRCDLVVLTGGLGPTKDDLTKETLAEVLGRELIYDETAKRRITDYFKKTGRYMAENNLQQALVIEGSVVFQNDNGLACGMAVKSDGCLFILLPGPPKELKPMFNKYANPYLKSQLKDTTFIQSRVLRFFDIGESQLVEQIDDLIENQVNPTIAPLAGDGDVTLRLTVKGSDEAENQRKLNNLQEIVLARLDKYFYGLNDDSLFKQVFLQLKEGNVTIAAAESLTGGLFSAELTNIPGASAIFKGGFVTYTNEGKANTLNVAEEILHKHGAVSRECAEEMAKGARLKGESDYGISFTGVAGPDSSEGKPPGLVYIGIASREAAESYELRLAGSRTGVRERSVKYGAYYLIQFLRKEMEKVDG